MNNFHIVDDINSDSIQIEVMKKGYGRGLLEAGKMYPNVVAASSDVVASTGTDAFSTAFPDRFIEVGIAEQNLVAVGSGLAAMGKIPYVAAYAAFSPGRNWEQIKTTICINNRPVKIISTHVGISDAPDGATHQMLEDVALMRVLPNMTVIAPCDSLEAYRATIAVAGYDKPVYMRIARDDTATITTDNTPFEIGKAYVYREGSDITIISTGRMTYRALQAAEKLKADNINAEVVHVPTIKPLDEQTILKSVRKTGLVVTAEEGQAKGGLGGAIAELLAVDHPVRMCIVGVNDRFGESGSPEELFKELGLTMNNIVLSCHSLLQKK